MRLSLRLPAFALRCAERAPASFAVRREQASRAVPRRTARAFRCARLLALHRAASFRAVCCARAGFGSVYVD
jgi:hypothetical protein